MKTKMCMWAALVLAIIGATSLPGYAATAEDAVILENRGMAARQEAEKKTEQITSAKQVAPVPAEPQRESSPVIDLPVDETDSPTSTALPHQD